MMVKAGWGAICEECGRRITPGDMATLKPEHGCYRHISCHEAAQVWAGVPHPADRLSAILDGAWEALHRYRLERSLALSTRVALAMARVYRTLRILGDNWKGDARYPRMGRAADPEADARLKREWAIAKLSMVDTMPVGE